MLYRRLFPLSLTVIVVGGALATMRDSNRGHFVASHSEDTPEDCVLRMLSAEAAGDQARYLSCFVDSQRIVLNAAWEGRTASDVAEELRSRGDSLVGRAVTNVQFADPDHSELIVERLSLDQAGRQRATLVRQHRRWEITSLSEIEWKRPTIPYGTPVGSEQ